MKHFIAKNVEFLIWIQKLRIQLLSYFNLLVRYSRTFLMCTILKGALCPGIEISWCFKMRASTFLLIRFLTLESSNFYEESKWSTFDLYLFPFLIENLKPVKYQIANIELPSVQTGTNTNKDNCTFCYAKYTVEKSLWN